ncbi:putative bifunctional diguanylate cyclase/phosphodiesterase [Roseibium sp.]|uniref:putative bifunctional diguanylate cyclase/phosphodiesterase n=1 Tax=Roseibium sp. TaxID=1936156 RepID=UPI003A975B6B
MKLPLNLPKIGRRATRDAVLVAAGTLVAWIIAILTDAFDIIINFLAAHEEWELDEIFLAVLCSGLGGYIYSIRRLSDLRREVAAREIAETRAQWNAYHDHQTRLPNRRFLEDRAPRIVENQYGRKGFSVLAINLDDFKKVNDLAGQCGGDAVLKEVGARLTGLFPDGLVIQLGGDEFLAIDRAMKPLELKAMALEVVRTLTTPMLFENAQLEVGACVGFSAAPTDGDSLLQLASHADIALCVAKRTGRNMVQGYEPFMKKALAVRADIEKRLRLALTAREISPYYQPLIDLQTGEIRAFEALARWRDPDNGFISPDIFIAMAEDIGLIMELTNQLLTQACNDAASWPKNIQLAVNLSPKMMVDRLLGIRIIRILAQTGLAPFRLEIEITESALIADIDLAKTVINDLRTAGIKVVLDDFGTGYSSLSQLSNLYFDKIKIDKSFVATFQSNDKQMNIVRTVIALGKGLGIAITAEGIENVSQMDALRQLGCRFGQGFLIGKAIPSEEVPQLLEHQCPHLKREATSML